MKTQRPNNNPPPANDNILDNIDDEHFIAALSEAFRTYKTIQTHMNAAGYPTTTNIICKRMNEFVEMFPEVIEKRGKSWRIVPHGNETNAPIEKPTRTMPPPICDLGVKPLAVNTVHNGDCMTLMKRIPDQSVNLILVDPPFGTTRAKTQGRKIDIPLDLAALWEQYRRILAPNGNIVAFGSQPNTTDMINAGRKWYKYTNIWMKQIATGCENARNKPMKNYEDIMVFSPGATSNNAKVRATFNPWQARDKIKTNNPRRNAYKSFTDTKPKAGRDKYNGLEDCPRMVLRYDKIRSKEGHPFAKPVDLLNDLIRMYSNENDVVLDHCAGGGPTVLAAIGAGRQWIAIEKDPHWFEFAKARIAGVISELAANDNATVPEVVAANDDQPVTKPTRKSRKPRAA